MSGPTRLLTATAMLMLAAPSFAQENALTQQEGLAAWQEVYAVFSHPRCANCHVADERPRWVTNLGSAERFHAFNVQRGVDGSGFGNSGLRCTSCHFESNSKHLNGPPGAPNWHLAPAEMVWHKISSAGICAQIKDPERNGDRTLEEIAEHVRDDPLVGWGWNPGPGRQPAPGSAEKTYEELERWAAAGAPCPHE